MLKRMPLSDLQAQTLNIVDFTDLQVTTPHAIYNLNVNEVVGDGNVTGRITGFCYLIEVSGKPAAVAELRLDESWTVVRLKSVSFGHQAHAISHGLRQLAVLDQVIAGSYEVRVFRIPNLYLMAIWLKSDTGDDDIIYPLGAKPGLAAETPYAMDDLLELLVRTRRNR